MGEGLKRQKMTEKHRGQRNADIPSSPHLFCSKTCTWPGLAGAVGGVGGRNGLCPQWTYKEEPKDNIRDPVRNR